MYVVTVRDTDVNLSFKLTRKEKRPHLHKAEILSFYEAVAYSIWYTHKEEKRNYLPFVKEAF